MSPAQTNDERNSQRAIARGLVWVSIFALAAKLAGAGKEVAIAARFGVGTVVDAYGLVFATAMLPMGICLSVLGAVIVPLEAMLWKESPQVTQRFRSELLTVTMVLGLGIGTMLFLILPWMASNSAAPAVAALAREMVPGMAVAGGLGVVVSLFSAWILSSGRHVNSALDGVIAMVLMLVVIAAPSPDGNWLVVGTVVGVALHLLLAVTAHGRHSGFVRPTWRLGSSAWTWFLGALGLMGLGQVLGSLTSMLEVLIAARLGEGAVSVLGYANRLLALFSGLATLVITRAFMPVLAGHNLRNPDQARALVRVWLVRALWAGSILGLLVAVAAEPLVRVVFERGRFSADDTMRVASVLQFAACQLPITLPCLVLSSYAAASRRYRLLLVTGASTLLCVPTTGWLLSSLLGLEGLVIAPALGLVGSAAILWVGLRMNPRSRP